MKKFLLATTAFVVLAAASANAADLARPAYAPPPPPVYSWTGMYWGVNIGYSWGTAKNDFSISAPGFARFANESQNVDGVIGGGQSGYNYQFGAWVWGFETDIQASGQKGGSTFTVLAAPLTTVTTDHKLTWFGTARSRLGFLWSPNVLVYGTAGAAYGQVKDSAIVNLTGVGTIVTANRSDVKAGWTAGAGVEGAWGGGWSVKLEYLYMDLGKLEQTVTLPIAATSTSLTSRFTDNIVRVGLNYKWGGGGY